MHVSLYFHRGSWGDPGKPVVRRIPAVLYRSKSSHYCFGGTWWAITGIARPIQLPNWPGKIPEPGPPVEAIGFKPTVFVLMQDAAVKGCRRSGSRVEVYGEEHRDFTDFVTAKMRAVIEFPTEQEAARYAADFPTTADPGALDASASLDVDRSRSVVFGKRQKTAVVLAAIFTVVTTLIAVATLSLAGGLTLAALVNGVMVWPIAIGYLHESRKERFDLKEKWPRKSYERFATQAMGHASALAHDAKDLDIPLNPETGELRPLDDLIRQAPPDSYFPSFGMTVGAYVGAILVGLIGRQVEHEWRYNPDTGEPVLFFRAAQYWVSPIHHVRSVWMGKDPQTLDGFAKQMADEIQMRLAVSGLGEFIATGFVNAEWEDKALERIRQDAASAPATSHVLDETHFREKRLVYGDFEILYTEFEATRPDGAMFGPFLLIPSCRRTDRVQGTLDSSAPRSPGREDIMVVRLDGSELAPIGIQVTNYLEFGRALDTMRGRVAFDLVAVAPEAQVVTPRMRQQRPEAKDHMAPTQKNDDELPLSAAVNFIGRIEAVESMVNPFSSLPFWRIRLNIESVSLTVLVRKDKCSGMPEKGQFLSGAAWLQGRMAKVASAGTNYIG